MDFVSDALFDGRRLRALTVVDAFTREALTIDVDQGIKGEQVVAAVTRIASVRGAPKIIRVDNGPELGRDPRFFIHLDLETGPRRDGRNEAEVVFGRADHRHPEGGRGECGGDGAVP